AIATIDGRTTFGLPDLRGRIPIHAGSGPGLSPRRLGAKAGAENVTLTVNQLPSHNHAWRASTVPANLLDPVGNNLGQAVADPYFDDLDQPTNLSTSAMSNVGGSRSHTNLQPFLCIHFIIALFGIYPSRH
ncbi:MAG: phage tail protein, partial [Acidobacteriota bacterium]